jgi:hypothetical protein
MKKKKLSEWMKIRSDTKFYFRKQEKENEWKNKRINGLTFSLCVTKKMRRKRGKKEKVSIFKSNQKKSDRLDHFFDLEILKKKSTYFFVIHWAFLWYSHHHPCLKNWTSCSRPFLAAYWSQSKKKERIIRKY